MRKGTHTHSDVNNNQKLEVGCALEVLMLNSIHNILYQHIMPSSSCIVDWTYTHHHHHQPELKNTKSWYEYEMYSFYTHTNETKQFSSHSNFRIHFEDLAVTRLICVVWCVGLMMLLQRKWRKWSTAAKHPAYLQIRFNQSFRQVAVMSYRMWKCKEMCCCGKANANFEDFTYA